MFCHNVTFLYWNRRERMLKKIRTIIFCFLSVSLLGLLLSFGMSCGDEETDDPNADPNIYINELEGKIKTLEREKADLEKLNETLKKDLDDSESNKSHLMALVDSLKASLSKQKAFYLSHIKALQAKAKLKDPNKDDPKDVSEFEKAIAALKAQHAKQLQLLNDQINKLSKNSEAKAAVKEIFRLYINIDGVVIDINSKCIEKIFELLDVFQDVLLAKIETFDWEDTDNQLHANNIALNLPQLISAGRNFISASMLGDKSDMEKYKALVEALYVTVKSDYDKIDLTKDENKAIDVLEAEDYMDELNVVVQECNLEAFNESAAINEALGYACCALDTCGGDSKAHPEKFDCDDLNSIRLNRSAGIALMSKLAYKCNPDLIANTDAKILWDEIKNAYDSSQKSWTGQNALKDIFTREFGTCEYVQ